MGRSKESVSDFSVVKVLEGHTGWVRDVFADADYIYTASHDNTIRVWNRSDFSLEKIIKNHTNIVNSVYADTDYIYTSSGDGTSRVWSRKDFSQVAVLDVGTGLWPVNITGVYADADYIYTAAGGYNHTTKVWSKKDFLLVMELKGKAGSFFSRSGFFGGCPKVFADSENIYTSSGDQTALVWRKKDFSLAAMLEGHTNGLTGVYADTDYLFTTTGDKTARIWNRRDFSLVRVLGGHINDIIGVYADADFIYTGSCDFTARVWSRRDFSPVKVLEGHSSMVLSVFADTENIFTSSTDGTARVWRLSRDKLTAIPSAIEVVDSVETTVPLPQEEPSEPATSELGCVVVKRGFERAGEWIKLGVKIINNSDFVINRVTVQIDEYPSALQYEEAGKEAVSHLQTINAGEYQSAIFRFKPIRCVDGSITGFVRYSDAKGKKHTIDIRSVDVKSVCPMLTSDGVTESEILDKLMDGHLNCNKVFIEFEGNVRSVFDVVQARLGRLILYDHDWRASGSAYIGHLFYLGKTKYAKKYFAAEFLLSGTSEDKGGLTISVYSDEPAILTGFFHEIVSDLGNHITVLKESSEVCGIGCGKCGGPLDIEKVVEGGYVKCEHCDFWNRIPKWKRNP